MGEAPQPQRVDSVAHLRYLFEQAPTGERLLLEIAPDISFEDARMMWEVATLKGGHAIFNPEMLRRKMEASDFVNARIRELKADRDYLNGRIGCMRSWSNMMQRDLEDGGPHIPADHKPLMMFGPPMFLDLHQIGSVEDFEKHREEILDEYLNLAVPAGGIDLDYWKTSASRWREMEDRRSLVNFNIDFLEIKIEILLLLRDRITKGIKALEGLAKERMHIGCGTADFGSFRDIRIGDGKDVD